MLKEKDNKFKIQRFWQVNFNFKGVMEVNILYKW